MKSIQADTQSQGYIFPAPRNGQMLSDMSLTTLIKRIHEQKVKDDSLGYIDPKQNRVITTHGFALHFGTGRQIKLITSVKYVNMC